jgi:hypothetical protein
MGLEAIQAGRRGLSDEKVEREEWHLVQEGNTITGYYDRAVHQISTGGHAYRCSAALDFGVTARYQITGEVRGSRVLLQVRNFEILEGSPCDDGRRLDAYRGQARQRRDPVDVGRGHAGPAALAAQRPHPAVLSLTRRPHPGRSFLV